ncbi:hypothetical protein PV11_04628 [Exophiala sideris]|uniref:Arrestin-like N-terminal domain-containing protein n=2 Tax=Exophiala sideris TaxID=1016849 RepID=A0A0D1W1C8_9EURO|nr:hypothetical protein PV11_04628 [Exophiala sideris]
MSVHIQFDQPRSTCYTNLDFISGRVILVLPSDASISAVTVKLEGESRVRLAVPKFPGNERSDKKRTELEVHKLLYKVLTLFPTAELQETGSGNPFTLLAGQYTYPFSFKFPFNNDCQKSPAPLKDIKLGLMNLQFAPDTNTHVKKSLPPSLSGFPGLAEIKYYVKATVVRPKFFQGNMRSVSDIKFLPIEPPRPRNRDEEIFARRKRQFQHYNRGLPQMKGLFKKAPTPMSAHEEAPAFQIDARLPSPAILTCNEPLPLRILIQKLNDSSSNAFLSMLQIDLIGHTYVRAHDLERTETTTWQLMSQANMNMPLGSPSEKNPKEWKLPSRLWDHLPLPNTVCPTFETCNISRRYELEVRVGLAHGEAGDMRPEVIVLPLRLAVMVYSGIAPPEKLLRAMANNPRPQLATAPLFPRPRPNDDIPRTPQTPVPPQTPVETPTTPLSEINYSPAQTGYSGHDHQHDLPDEAPPSYEDAIADEIAPVDGPRRDYQVPEQPESQVHVFNTDSKAGKLGRRVSERLFASSTPSAPPRSMSTPNNVHSVPIAEDDDQDISGLPVNGQPVPSPNSRRDMSEKKG